MAQKWHYAWQGKSEGPVDDLTMQDLIRAGRVQADTMVWREGMTGWERADAHFAFAAKPFAPASPFAPPPPNAPPPLVTSARGPLYAGAPARGFTEAIKVCFSKYATFRGRASRSEYWFFQLFVLLGAFIGGVVEGSMGHDGQVISGLVSLATFLPMLSVTVRRLHDTEHSGWWIGGFYLALIPLGLAFGVIGAIADQPGADPGAAIALFGLLILLGIFAYGIAMLVFLCKRGTPGPNRFG